MSKLLEMELTDCWDRKAHVDRAMEIPGWYSRERLVQLSYLAWPYKDLPGLEIGTWYGRSAYVIAAAGVKLTCIDTWKGLPQEPDAKRYAEAHTVDMLAEAKKYLAGFDVTFVQERSNKALLQYPNRSFNFIHIDGDHSFPVVNKDVATGWWLLRPEGILCGDDFDEPMVREAVVSVTRSFADLTLHVFGGKLWWIQKGNDD